VVCSFCSLGTPEDRSGGVSGAHGAWGVCSRSFGQGIDRGLYEVSGYSSRKFAVI
jgi:hypothetical protein